MLINWRMILEDTRDVSEARQRSELWMCFVLFFFNLFSKRCQCGGVQQGRCCVVSFFLGGEGEGLKQNWAK